jgi:hypothetical protein
VLAKTEQELFRGGNSVTGECIHGVLLGIGSDHVAVVAGGVCRFEVATQLRGDVEVLDLVAVGVPGDFDQSDFGLAVLVLAQDDAGAGGGFHGGGHD